MRGSDRSNRREDEQRRRETEGLVTGAPVNERDDAHLHETPAEGEHPIAHAARPLADERAGTDRELPITEAQEVADIARWFRPSVFPVDAGGAVAEARSSGAPEWIVESIEVMADERRFESAGALARTLAGISG
ncbi:MAG: hypothetical protein S0880_18030 [Actinomycetota bacterium]|nr:hypothetical protein [Actinomycetota bacterium]